MLMAYFGKPLRKETNMDKKNFITMLANMSNANFTVKDNKVIIHFDYTDKNVEFNFNKEGELTSVYCANQLKGVI